MERSSAFGYCDALQLAVDVAREAGLILRADFLQPSGANCQDAHHAQADVEVERHIRRRLLDATPDWGWRGEETGYIPAEDSSFPLWIVDPNDGTYFYCQGSRGSAISIALVRDGVPVLGVVYAHVAPDNDGDLFSWAEGCGPLRRNSEVCSRRTWQSEISRSTVVLVSQDGDRAPLANLTCVAPARYRAEVSIAYRLALAAVGEGEVAVSLGGTISWDYAGGHALLRGAGGDLVDENGQSVTYDASGMGRNRFCFGGAPDLVRVVARRPWPAVLSAPKNPENPLGLCFPRPGRHVADTGVIRRVQGCWLGQLVGDALADKANYVANGDEAPAGTTPLVLTRSPAASESALLLARILVRDGTCDAPTVAAAYRSRHCTERHGAVDGIGMHLGETVETVSDDPLLRQGVLAIWGRALDPGALDRISRIDTSLTLDTADHRDAAAAFAVALQAIITGTCGAEEAYYRARTWHDAQGVSDAVADSLSAAAHAPPDPYARPDAPAAVLQCAFYQAIHTKDFATGVLAALPHGRTASAASGALLGALYGAAAIPLSWRTAILTCRPMAGAPGVAQPRPETYWSVDAMIIAERLATCSTKL